MNWVYTGVALVVVFLAWEVRHQHEGKVDAQLELRDYKTAQVQAVADAEKAAADQLKKVESNNAAVMADLQTKLDDSATNGERLATRLRIALASIHPSPLPSAQDQPAASSPSGVTGSDPTLEATAAVFAACERDGSRLDALISEIKLQL